MKKFLYAALSLLMLASCSDDPLKGTNGQGGSNPEDNVPGVYIGVNFQMPGMSSSRSTTTDPDDENNSTSNDGTEVGKDYENNVNEVLLILARPNDYGFIAAAKVQSDYIFKHTGDNSIIGNVESYHANAKFEKSKLEDYYSKSEFSEKIAVFVVVNPNGGLQSYFESMNPVYGNTKWINEGWQVSSKTGENAIWSTANGGNFLMTNTRIAIREIPKTFEAWEQFSKRDTPFHLSEANKVIGTDNGIDNSTETDGRGPVNVHRACARFDFRDGSKTGDNTYTAVYLQTKEGTNSKQPFLYVTLQRLSLVNMNNKFYYFERVSDNGRPIDNSSDPKEGICEPEKRWYDKINNNDNPLYDFVEGNYVVDYYADNKYDAIQYNFDGSKVLNVPADIEVPEGGYPFNHFFEYPLFDNNKTINSNDLSSQSRWASSEISDILDNETDQYEGDGATEYCIWRYVTENVIPYANTPTEYYQPNGLTTGIVFRGKISAEPHLPSETEFPDLTGADRARFEHVIEAINTDKKPADVDETTFLQNSPILYMYAKKLYATWNDISSAAVEASLVIKKENADFVPEWNRNNSLYKAVFGNGSTGCTIIYNTTDDGKLFNVYLPNDPDLPKKVGNNGNKIDYTNGETFTDNGITKIVFVDNPQGNPVEDGCANQKWIAWVKAGRPDSSSDITKAFKKAVTNGDITIYQRSNEDGVYGYYCYYYYWNRHNDNNRDGVMGPMEFCTVRNNVYKLSVTDISRLGHPRLDENDPDSPKPDTPDESSNVYITVDSKVIPWVVRINDIQF